MFPHWLQNVGSFLQQKFLSMLQNSVDPYIVFSCYRTRLANPPDVFIDRNALITIARHMTWIYTLHIRYLNLYMSYVLVITCFLCIYLVCMMLSWHFTRAHQVENRFHADTAVISMIWWKTIFITWPRVFFVSTYQPLPNTNRLCYRCYRMFRLQRKQPTRSL